MIGIGRILSSEYNFRKGDGALRQRERWKRGDVHDNEKMEMNRMMVQLWYLILLM